MGAHSKTPVIRRRRARKEKIAKLRQRYAASTSDAERTRILEKLKKLSPLMSREQFLQGGGPKPPSAA